MRVILSLVILSTFWGAVYADSQEGIVDALKSYQLLLEELQRAQKVPKRDCSTDGQSDGPKNETKSYCSIQEFCSDPSINYDSPILYQNSSGRQIENFAYFRSRQSIRACLKEGHKDQLQFIRDKAVDRLKAGHIKKIIAANKKLNKLADRYKQRESLQKVSSAVLELSLLAGLNSGESNWDAKEAPPTLLKNMLTLAEKKAKVKLHPDIKATLIDIQLLKNNPTYLSQMQTIEEALIPEVRSQDPLNNWSLLTDEAQTGGQKALEKNRERLVLKTQAGYELFKDTQAEMIRYFESRKNEMNKENIERIIERVQTMSFTPPRLIEGLEEHCAKGANALYDEEKHSLILCPQLLNYPEMEMIETMAHEMSHSFDSCALSKRMYKLKGPEVVGDAPFEIEIKMKPQAFYRLESGFQLIEEKKPGLTQDRMSYKDHPFSQTMSCLQDPQSLGAVGIDRTQIQKKVQERLEELERLGQNNSQNKEARYLNFLNNHKEAYFDYHEGCNFSESTDLIGRSQLIEGFADKMASEVVARKMQKLSQSQAQRAMLEIILSYRAGGTICTNESKSETLLREFAEKEGCKDYYANYSNEEKMLKGLEILDPKFTTHSDDQKRIERIFLAHPMIRKALNCSEKVGMKYCE